MAIKLAEGLYQIPVPLAGNPLGFTNTYLWAGAAGAPGGRWLLVDTGLDEPACEAALRAELASLNVDLARLDIFFTHLHNDHAGLIQRLLVTDTRVFCDRLTRDYAAMLRRYHSATTEIAQSFGADPQCFAHLADGFDYHSEAWPEVIYLKEGDMLAWGGLELRYLETPGHMLGHGCLYAAERGRLFCGDAVLRTVTPSVQSYQATGRELHDYTASLHKLAALTVTLGLPGHGPLLRAFQQRVSDLLSHHQERLREVRLLLNEQPRTVAWTAERMRWNLAGRAWRDFGAFHQFFAMGEAFAHLLYLAQEQELRMALEDGVYLFSRS